MQGKWAQLISSLMKKIGGFYPCDAGEVGAANLHRYRRSVRVSIPAMQGKWAQLTLSELFGPTKNRKSFSKANTL